MPLDVDVMPASRIMQRRQAFGSIVLLCGLLLLLTAMFTHIPRLGLMATLVAGVGMWMIARRGSS
jgi:hypothetical protein